MSFNLADHMVQDLPGEIVKVGGSFVVDPAKSDEDIIVTPAEVDYSYRGRPVFALALVSFIPEDKSFHLSIVNAGTKSRFALQKIEEHDDIVHAEKSRLAGEIEGVIIGGGHARIDQGALIIDGAASSRARTDSRDPIHYTGVPAWLMEGFQPGIRELYPEFEKIRIRTLIYWDQRSSGDNDAEVFFDSIKQGGPGNFMEDAKKTGPDILRSIWPKPTVLPASSAPTPTKAPDGQQQLPEVK
jgi:hypothetical protein